MAPSPRAPGPADQGFDPDHARAEGGSGPFRDGKGGLRLGPGESAAVSGWDDRILRSDGVRLA